MLALLRNMAILQRVPFLVSLMGLGNTRIIFHKPRLIFRVLTLLDVLTLKEVVLDRCYEQDVSVSEKDRVIVDIGAGFGDFAVSIAKRYPKASIYAFEPDLKYFSLLKENIRENKVRNIIAVPLAIQSFTDLGKTVKGGHIAFLKSDCEGCEFQITRTDGSLWKRVGKVAMEYHEGKGRNVEDLKNFFLRAGFRVAVSPHASVLGIGFLSAKRSA
jgi:predicted RNA methylase